MVGGLAGHSPTRKLLRRRGNALKRILALAVILGLAGCGGSEVGASSNIDDLLSSGYLTDAERDALLEQGVRERMGADRLAASFPLIQMTEAEFDELQEAIADAVQNSQNTAVAVEAGARAAVAERGLGEAEREALREALKKALKKAGVSFDGPALDAVTEAAAEKVVEKVVEMAAVVARITARVVERPTITVTRNMTVTEPAPPPTPWTVDGSGDDIVAVPRWITRLRIEAASHGGGNFAVWCVGADGEPNDLLVNEMVHDSPYSGLRRLRGCAELDLNASGVSWTLTEP